MQTRLTVALGAICLALAGSAVGATLPPTGTPLRLKLEELLDSHAVHTGQHFKLSVGDDVRVGDEIVVPKGALAQGTVLFARKKGSGRSGALDIRVDWVDTPAGRVKVRASENHRSEYIARQAQMATALIGIAGLLIQGDDVVLQPGISIDAEVAAPTPVAAATTATDATAPAPTTTATASSGIPTPAAAAQAPATGATAPSAATDTTSNPSLETQ